MSEQKTKIAFQGHVGAYSDMACRAVYPERETLPCPSFEAAFQAVLDDRAELAMIPVDNTIAGRVADVHHFLPRSGLYIIGEHFEPIRHALLGIKGSQPETLKYVHSHVHAIPQCRNIIKEMRLSACVQTDTAGAAAIVAQKNDPAHGAIASSLAAQIYGLDILIDNIQDSAHNMTRFLVLSKEHQIPLYRKEDKVLTSLVYTVRNIPAALYKSLGGFATNGVSIAKLESYVGEGFSVARFYAEPEAHPDNPSMQQAFDELKFYADDITMLGTYPAHPLRFSS